MTKISENVPVITAPELSRASSLVPVRAIGQGLINLVLVMLTVRDIRKRSDDELNGSRKLWLLAAFAPPIGPIAYLVFGRKRGSGPAN